MNLASNWPPPLEGIFAPGMDDQASGEKPSDPPGAGAANRGCAANEFAPAGGANEAGMTFGSSRPGMELEMNPEAGGTFACPSAISGCASRANMPGERFCACGGDVVLHIRSKRLKVVLLPVMRSTSCPSTSITKQGMLCTPNFAASSGLSLMLILWTGYPFS